MNDTLTLALAQITPELLNREKTIEKVLDALSDAAGQNADLMATGEALIPGYPFWVELTHGAVFNDEKQKEAFALYAEAAVSIEGGDLEPICKLAKEKGIAGYYGTIEKAQNRGGHSLYATMVYIDKNGEIGSVHRKLMPTYEERLVWSPGDGNGLRVHKLGTFTVGGLNCWENWMPLPRAALYGQGEDLHVAIWPGSIRNTHDITTFIAKEGRSYVMSVSGLMSKEALPSNLPFSEEMISNAPEQLTDGGSCLAAPDGSWVVEPFHEEKVVIAEIDHNRVLRERQNFDPVGHYSRPDVTRLEVNRERQQTVYLKD
jgi:nitrilase